MLLEIEMFFFDMLERGAQPMPISNNSLNLGKYYLSSVCVICERTNKHFAKQ